MAAGDTTVGELIFQDIVPEEYRGDGDLTASGVKDILEQVAHRDPEMYREISHKLLRLGAKGSVETNTSFTLDDLKSPVDKDSLFADLRTKVDRINSSKTLTDEQKRQRKLNLYGEMGQKLPEDVFRESMKRDSGLARMVAAGARGSKGQLNSNIGADMLVSDSSGRPIPVPITSSYGEGLSPAEYFAASYGTRLGLVATKFTCSEDTPVRMADGSKRAIKDVSPGDWVAGSDRHGNVIPVRVLNRFDHGMQRCRRHSFRIHSTGSLVSVDASDDHKMLAKIRAWGKAKKYGVNEPTQLPLSRVVSNSARQYVAVPAQTGLEVSGRTEPYAMLIGLLLGDGHATSTKQVSFSCADPLMLEDVEEYLSEVNFRLKKSRPDHPECNRYVLNYVKAPPKKIAVPAGDPGFGGKRTESGCPFREKVGEWGWFDGRLAPDKVFPDEIYQWDNHSVARAIGGLYSADGSIGRSGQGACVRLCLTSRAMLEQVRDLLQVRFGIYSAGVSEVDVSKNKWARNRQWVLKFSHRSALRAFFSHIPLVGKKRLKAQEILEFLDDNPSGREDNVFSWTGSEDLGEVQTYDIEVDHPDHLFVLANGLVTSNSVQQGGYFAKQLSAASADLIVTEEDCGTTEGLPVDVGDKSNIGAVLARDAGGVKAGTVVTPKVMRQISGKGAKRAVMRSPVACRAKGGGICARCAGVREQNRFPAIGENVGIPAANGIAEPVSQALLCLAEGTLVKMADGTDRPIERVEPGEMVLGASMGGTLRPVRVVRRYDNGPREVWRTSFKLGINQEATIESTLDHKVLSSWQKSNCSGEELNNVPQLLPVGERANKYAAHLPSGFDDPGMPDEEWAMFLGLMIGDGCCTEAVASANFSCADQLLLDDLEEYLGGLNLKLTKLTGHDYYYKFSQVEQEESLRDGTTGQFVGGTDRNPAKVACKGFGLWGKYAHEKSIPEEAWGWSNRSVADLLAGLFATDGSIYLGGGKMRASYGSTSRELVEQMRELLLIRFGIRTTENSPRTNGERSKRPLYSFSISTGASLRSFVENVPVPGIKARKLRDWAGKIASDRKGVRCPRKRGAEFLGMLPTYDLEVDHPDHIFLCSNGLLVANSTKHTAGVASAGGSSQVTGFPQIDALAQVPRVYPNAATLADLDGRVTRVDKAPHGGTYITVGDERHYVPEGAVRT